MINAIELAGGATEQADLSKINLAAKLVDGCKLYVPNINEQSENINNNSGIIIDVGNGAQSKVNINTAGQSELETLVGIGPSIASKIIEYREKKGKFKKIEDLKNVTGIGAEKFNSIKDSVVVK